MIKKIVKLAAGILLPAALASCSVYGNRTIQFYSTKSENVETLNKLAKIYEEEKHNIIDVKIIAPAPRKSTEVLITRMKKGDYPDIIAMGGNAIYTEFVKNDYLLNLTGEKVISNIKPAYLKMLHTLDPDDSAKTYAVPYSANISGILLNMDIFEKYEIPTPNTWSELLETIQILKSHGIAPFGFPFYDDWTTLPIWNSLVAATIPDSFVAEKNSGESTFAETHNEILEKFAAILKSANNNDFMGNSYEDANKAFALGKTAMLINGNWVIPEVIKYNPDIKIDMIAFPSFDDKRKNFVTTGLDVILTLPKKTGNNRNAMDFLNFLTRPDIAQKYIQEQFAFSAVKGADSSKNVDFTINKSVTDGKICDYPDHFYPVNFGSELSIILAQFCSNYTKGVPDSSNIQVTLQNLDKVYDSLKE